MHPLSMLANRGLLFLHAEFTICNFLSVFGFFAVTVKAESAFHYTAIVFGDGESTCSGAAGRFCFPGRVIACSHTARHVTGIAVGAAGANSISTGTIVIVQVDEEYT